MRKLTGDNSDISCYFVTSYPILILVLIRVYGNIEIQDLF